MKSEKSRIKTEDTLAACDIGTTTVVCYLIDKETGQIISTRSGANPQRSLEQMYFPGLMRQRGRMITIKRMAACR